MITLITATPGGGKTALMVHDFISPAVSAGRLVLVHNVPGLTLPHEPLPPLSEWTENVLSDADSSVEVSRFCFPRGALVVVDEAQEVYRVRPAGMRVPSHVAALERHRHQGLDFVLVTQEPALLDSHVRRLVGRHIHIRATGLGRFLYEWPSVADAPDKNYRTAPVKTKWRLPRSVFGAYRSASLHVRPVRRIPTGAWVLLACVLIAFPVGWYGYQSVRAKMVPAAPVPVSPVISAAVAQPVTDTASPSPALGGAVVDYMPRLTARPETAPLYDGVRQVRDMPVVAGCVQSRVRCVCVTQQGSDAFLSPAECREWLRSPPFDPWRGPSPPTVSTVSGSEVVSVVAR